MALLSLLHRWLVPVAQAVVLENAGSWSPSGAPNPGVQMMWARICRTLPFCGVGPAAPAFFVGKVIRFIFLAIGGIAVLMIIYAGIKLIIAQGSDEALTEARKIVLYAAAGIVLSIIGNALIVYISSVVLPQALR